MPLPIAKSLVRTVKSIKPRADFIGYYIEVVGFAPDHAAERDIAVEIRVGRLGHRHRAGHLERSGHRDDLDRPPRTPQGYRGRPLAARRPDRHRTEPRRSETRTVWSVIGLALLVAHGVPSDDLQAITIQRGRANRPAGHQGPFPARPGRAVSALRHHSRARHWSRLASAWMPP